LFSYDPPQNLTQTGEEEGQKYQGKSMCGIFNRQSPQQGDPQLDITRAHAAFCPCKEQKQAGKPQIRGAGKMSDESCNQEWKRIPVWDSPFRKSYKLMAKTKINDQSMVVYLMVVYVWVCGKCR